MFPKAGKIETGSAIKISAAHLTISPRLRNRLKKEVLLILPDKVFIIRGSKVGAVNYDDLQIQISSINFVESEPVPKDAQVIGQTWQYVNRNGTPDKRYKNNRQLPICLYGVVRLRSASGINVEMHISNIQKSRDFDMLIR